ncbi:MAG: efflux RND transporter periplasmic adaptor subunit [Isosphaeraceae bacterium]
MAAISLVASGAGAWLFWENGGGREESSVAGEASPPARPSASAAPVGATVGGTVRLAKEQQSAIGLRTVRASESTTHHLVTAPGRVAPNETRYAFITPRAPGVVRSVNVHIGQAVKAGDLLATIDSPVVGDARLELYTRLQTLEIANAQADWQSTIYLNTMELLDRLKKQESPQQITDEFSERAVGENRERLMTAYAQYRLASATLDRNRELYSQKLITPKQFQQVTADYEVAQATYQSLMDQMGFEVKLANRRAQQAKKQAETAVRAAQERLRILGVRPDGTEPEVVQGKVKGVNPDGTLPAPPGGAAPVDERPEAILPKADEGGKVAVEPVGSPADHVRASTDAPVSNYSIWAPFDGTILDRERVVPGVSVDAATRIFTLADLSSVYVEVNIHEHDFEALNRTQGGKVRFSTPAYPEKPFDGEVIYSGDLVEETSRTIKLLARAKNPDRLLKPGMFVNVEILNAERTAGIQVPSSALLTLGKRSFVYVQEAEDVFVQREVKFQPAGDDTVLILDGLEPSDQVVVEGAFKLKSLDTFLATAEN